MVETAPSLPEGKNVAITILLTLDQSLQTVKGEQASVCTEGVGVYFVAIALG